MDKLDKNLPPNKTVAAVCGLYCPACTAYIAAREEPQRLSVLAARMGRTVDDVACEGCRSDKRSFFCRELCTMKPCAEKKGVDFCSECDEYPCESLKTFQAAAPHRRELWSSLERIKEKGHESWSRDMAALYACPSCGVLNSAYDLKCRHCGTAPSCEYTRRHRDAVLAHLSKK
jgi:hypothetical protein